MITNRDGLGLEFEQLGFVVVDDDSMVVTNVGCCEAGLYRAKGDYDAAHDLVETYGVKTEAALGRQVKSRFGNLPTKAYSGFVQPKLVPIKDSKGKILDVQVTRELDFVQQMIRYGKEYSFLPVNN